MKKAIFLILLGIAHFSAGLATDFPSELVTGFKSGNARLIAEYFNETVEMKPFDKEEKIYSKSHAEQVLTEFFRNYPPIDFEYLHDGGKESSKYYIYNLKTRNKSFRITFLLKTMNSKVFIHQLRIVDSDVE